MVTAEQEMELASLIDDLGGRGMEETHTEDVYLTRIINPFQPLSESQQVREAMPKYLARLFDPKKYVAEVQISEHLHSTYLNILICIKEDPDLLLRRMNSSNLNPFDETGK